MSGNGSSAHGFLASKPRQSLREMAARIDEQPIVVIDNPELVTELRRTQERLSVMEDKFDALVRELQRSNELRASRRNSTMSMSSVSSTTGDIVKKPDSGKTEIPTSSTPSETP